MCSIESYSVYCHVSFVSAQSAGHSTESVQCVLGFIMRVAAKVETESISIVSVSKNMSQNSYHETIIPKYSHEGQDLGTLIVSYITCKSAIDNQWHVACPSFARNFTDVETKERGETQIFDPIYQDRLYPHQPDSLWTLNQYRGGLRGFAMVFKSIDDKNLYVDIVGVEQEPSSVQDHNSAAMAQFLVGLPIPGPMKLSGALWIAQQTINVPAIKFQPFRCRTCGDVVSKDVVVPFRMGDAKLKGPVYVDINVDIDLLRYAASDSGWANVCGADSVVCVYRIARKVIIF